MRLNAISPKDNPMDEVLYCFGSAGDFGDEKDQQKGQGYSGPSGSSGTGRDDGDSERDRVAKDAGVSRDTIVGSGPGGGNIVTSGDGKTPVKAGRAVEREAEREGVSVEEINRRINDAYEAYSFDAGSDDTPVADTSTLDEIATEFDTIDDAEFYEDQILRDLRKEDYSAVFGQPINEVEEASITPEPTAIDNVIAGAEALADRIQSGEALQNVKKGFDRLVDSIQERFGLGEEEAVRAAERVFTGFDGPTPTEIGFRDSDLKDAVVGETERSRAITDLITAFQSSKEAKELPSSGDPRQQVEDLLASIGERVTEVSDIEPFSIERIENLTDYFRSNPANPEILQTNVGDFPVSELLASTEPLTDLQKEQLDRAAAAAVAAQGEDTTTDFLPEQAIAESLGGAGTDKLAQARTDLGLPEDATAEDILNALNARKATNADVADIVIQIPDEEATVQRNPAMGFSPYEQLSTIDPETKERVALDFRTSLGGPDNFGEVDFEKFAEPISVFGVDVPNALGVAESILNTFIDPTGTTERAVYEGGVRSVDGRATGLDTGIDLVTDGTQQVIGGYDRDRNIVYATEGNLFNPALSDFYEEKRRADDAARDDGDEARPLAGGLEILPQSTLSAYDFGSSSFDPFSIGTGTGTGTGSIDSLPAVGAPAFDFMRDFGAFTLSPQPDQMPEGAYSPTYLAPISEMTAEERQGLVGLLGTPLGAELGLSDIDLGQTPTESAEALIRGLSGDQSV